MNPNAKKKRDKEKEAWIKYVTSGAVPPIKVRTMTGGGSGWFSSSPAVEEEEPADETERQKKNRLAFKEKVQHQKTSWIKRKYMRWLEESIAYQHEFYKNEKLYKHADRMAYIARSELRRRGITVP